MNNIIDQIELDYSEFLDTKPIKCPNHGFLVDESAINPKLFPFQRRIVRQALLKGRYAVLIDCGLGKTAIQLEWLNQIRERLKFKSDKPTHYGLIICPLSVANQTIEEALKFNIPDVGYAEKQEDIKTSIVITNYERLSNFDSKMFDAVVMDESSIVKSVDGKTKKTVFKMFKHTPFRLSCSATPAPNDHSEIGNQSEFLGVMPRVEMLAKFFVHDEMEYKLKGYAEQSFYQWLAQWSVMIRKPSDIGYEDNGFILPPITIDALWTDKGYIREGELFATSDLKGIQDRLIVRRNTIKDKAEKIIELINQSNEQWLIWCGLNDEADLLEKLIPGSVQLSGKQMKCDKIIEIDKFKAGEIRTLITKPKIAGFGMNFQNCHNMIFMGLNDSWESYYQCIRRQWRFGQKNHVKVWIVLNEVEQKILDNVRNKEKQANNLYDGLVYHVAEFNKIELEIQKEVKIMDYKAIKKTGTDFEIINGDCIEETKHIQTDSIDFTVFSPPFSSLYTYSDSARDIGNCKDDAEFWGHFNFLIPELLRITKPGRNCAVHCMNIPAMLCKDDYIGLKDFRGDLIRAFEKVGFIYHGEVCIDKNPQAQAIRTHSKGLAFTSFKKDSAWARPALPDYILIFRKPGENLVPIKTDVTNNEWIQFAYPVWYQADNMNITLNYRIARTDKDEKHIAPLQLEVIRRCIRLWSNEGETVFSPFMGIGSEGYVALELNRKFVGIELKQEYFNLSFTNLTDKNKEKNEGLLFNVV